MNHNGKLETKKIYYDITHVIPVNEQMVFHGGGYYGLKLLTRILEYNRDNIRFTLLWPREYFISNCEEQKLWEDQTIEKILVDKIENIDFEDGSLLIFPNFNCNSNRNYKMLKTIYRKNKTLKIITTIHDMRFLLDLKCDFYNRYYYNCNGIIQYLGGYLREIYHIPKTLARCGVVFRRINKIGKICRTICTSSNFSFQQLIKYTNIKNINWFFLDIRTNIERKSLPDLKKHSFILFVSGNRKEKNLARTLVAYLQSVKEGKTHFPLYITGPEKSITEMMNRIPGIDKAICNQMVKCLGFVSESEMQWLYSSCLYLLYTSKFEGFGLPACNALLYGRPVIASNRTSIPEICGSSALYVDPYDLNSIKHGIESFSEEEILSAYERKAFRYSNILKEMGSFGEDMMIQNIYQLL